MRVNLGAKGYTIWPKIISNVTDIRIQNNALTDIPDSIQNYKELTRIIIDGNRINKISRSILNLKHLTDFRISNNGLSQLPEVIFELRTLSVLYANHNNITKITPEIGELTALSQLNFGNNLIDYVDGNIGKLTGLVHLDLSSNPIEYLPPSIKNLTNLQTLNLTGTKLPLPPNHEGLIPKTLIEFVIENQKVPSVLNIKNASVLLNFGDLLIREKYRAILDEFTEEYEIGFTYIEDIDTLKDEINYLLIIVGFDVHSNDQLVFGLLDFCKSKKIQHKILFQKNTEGIEFVNLEKGPESKLMRHKIEEDYKDELIPFTSVRDLNDLILGVLKEHKPEVIISSLKLKNIGHFVDVDIKFDKRLTCIVGENGQGKSSIMKALALSIIGTNSSKVRKDESIKGLLRIEKIQSDGRIIYADKGEIQLGYTLDALSCENIIYIETKDEGRIFEVNALGDLDLNSGEFNLKSLIVGFPQVRGRIENKETTNRYTQPHIDDVFPLLTNEDYRLDSFLGWIANLYGKGIKDKSFEESSEGQIVRYVFEVISEITSREIKFISVQQFTPPIIIVSTPDAPNGLPLNLISQGFKIVIGWIGYFIQRRVEAFPLSNPYATSNEKSILIIDEIDSSIHPVWQSRLLDVLMEKFPRTQIICTTHSPLMIAGRDRAQILEIISDEGKLQVVPSSFDTWATSYQDILRLIFNTSEFIPKYTKEQLQDMLLEFKNDPVKKEEINETIVQLEESQLLVDDTKRHEAMLDEQIKELNSLIEKYKSKI